MQLTEIIDSSGESEFIRTNVLINARQPNYIRPMDDDIRAVFDKTKNKAFRQGECARWVLKDDEGALIGRIAAFVNKKYRSKGDEYPVGGIGFFDCIDNQAAADMLFDVARHWLLQRGMGAMDGPINFGERDTWWGLVVEGFIEPMYRMNFNAPYYKQLFEHYGFRVFFNQICFGMDPKKPLSKKVLDRHAILEKDPCFSARHIRKKQLMQYAEDFTEVYNKAWAGHGGMKTLKLEQAKGMFKQMKFLMDERLVWFAYYKDKPIAIFVNLPDINQWFKHLNGKLGLWQKIRFVWMKFIKPNKKFAGIVFGIVPEFQGRGVDAYIVAESAKVIQRKDLPYTEYEMQWIGDFNPKMINMAEGLGDVFRTRTLSTYRYLFDQTRPFHRHPMLS